MNIDAAPSDLARLRQAVLDDPRAQARLDRFDTVDAFVPQALGLAQAAGIALGEAQLRAALADDPLGLSRYSGDPPTGAHPPPGWLPIRIAPLYGQWCVDWAYFAARLLRESFFENSVSLALQRPLNRLARHRTRLIDLPACAERLEAPAPSGFIFHMSRCGSTLVAQMLAADPRHLAISEAAPLDRALLLHARAPAALGDDIVRATIAALTHRRDGLAQRAFVKLDSWHVLALPLLRRLYPDVPWIFVYREPVEVLASQALDRGLQMQPQAVPPALFGLGEEDQWPLDDYCARVLARTCAAAAEGLALGGGLLVNYRELPDAVPARILPHFGIAADGEMRARMTAVTGRDAKNAGAAFSADEDARRKGASPELRDIAAREIDPVYRRLEALRTAGADR